MTRTHFTLLPMLLAASIALFSSCLHDDAGSGLPAHAERIDEDPCYAVYLCEERGHKPQGIDIDTSRVTSVWVQEKKSGKAEKILTTHHDGFFCWVKQTDVSYAVHRDSVCVADNVVILDKGCQDGPRTLLVEGTPDLRNVYTYIIRCGADSALCLPTNGGYVGTTAEECLVVVQSYEYYEQGGRFNRLQVFDLDGAPVVSVRANSRADMPDEADSCM